MPELPEVETCRAGLAPHIEGKLFKHMVIRQKQLRWPVPEDLLTLLPGLTLLSVKRRAKYLLFDFGSGTLILHLGMSGKVFFCPVDTPVKKHDHIDFVFADDTTLRFNDQRRFGAVLWCASDIDQHPLLTHLGPEPLSDEFDGNVLFAKAKGKRVVIKSFIMDSHIVVGVGNIYASEALFLAGILPNRTVDAISLSEYQALASAIKSVLIKAIAQGGTTLRDFINPEGRSGYFQQSLNVYGRVNQECIQCAKNIEMVKIANRSSYFCPVCQS